VEGKEQVSTGVHLVLEDGILVSGRAKELDTIRAIGEEIVKSRLNFFDGKSYRMFSDITQTTGTDKEAVEYLLWDIAMQGVSAEALLISSVLSPITGKSFLKIAYKKPIPRRLVSDRDLVIKGLEYFKEK